MCLQWHRPKMSYLGKISKRPRTSLSTCWTSGSFLNFLFWQDSNDPQEQQNQDRRAPLVTQLHISTHSALCWSLAMNMMIAAMTSRDEYDDRADDVLRWIWWSRRWRLPDWINGASDCFFTHTHTRTRTSWCQKYLNNKWKKWKIDSQRADTDQYWWLSSLILQILKLKWIWMLMMLLLSYYRYFHSAHPTGWAESIRDAPLSKKCSFFEHCSKGLWPPPLLFEHLSYFAGGVF